MKGVIVAAGYGSRFLPVTRVVPKELLPLVDRPALQSVVDEFVEAGVTEVLVITSRRKRAIEDWFDTDVELAAAGLGPRLQRPTVDAWFVRQTEMRGTGHALLLARAFAGDDPILVAYPDDLFVGANVSRALVDAWKATGKTVLLAAELSGDVSRYGVLKATRRADGLLDVDGIVEKPPPGTEPSRFVTYGRYLYTPDVFPVLERGLAHHTENRGSGEFYATDALEVLAGRHRVSAVLTPARRQDTGDKLGYAQAFVERALAHPDIGAPFLSWMKELAARGFEP